MLRHSQSDTQNPDVIDWTAKYESVDNTGFFRDAIAELRRLLQDLEPAFFAADMADEVGKAIAVEVADIREHPSRRHARQLVRRHRRKIRPTRWRIEARFQLGRIEIRPDQQDHRAASGREGDGGGGASFREAAGRCRYIGCLL